MDEILSFIFRNQWLVLIIIGLVLVALAEVGFRAGLRLFVKKDEPRKGQIGAIQAPLGCSRPAARFHFFDGRDPL